MHWLCRIIQSMSRKGIVLDNSVMENFFGIMRVQSYTKVEFQIYAGVQRGNRNILIGTISRKGLKMKLNGMSPVQYRSSL